MVMLTDKTREELVERQAHRISQLEEENRWLREQFRLSKARQTGPSSERTSVELPSLFNEVEAEADACTADEAQLEHITYSRRTTRGPRELPVDDVEFQAVEYRLEPEDQICPQCSGPLHEMGTEERCAVEYIPAKLVGVKHVRYKYACRRCQKEEATTPILLASAPVPAFPGSLASASMVSHIMTQKFVMGVPLYRQEQQWERQGFNLSRQTMANWMIKGASWLDVIYDRLHQHLSARDVLCADETTVQVLHEEGRPAQKKSYMWLYRSGRDGPPIALFDYQEGRGGEHPKRFLQSFRGFLHADGYDGYDELDIDLTVMMHLLSGKPLCELPLVRPEKGVVLVGCWSHARRRFDQAIKVLPPATQKKGQSPAHVGLRYCNELFKIEDEIGSQADPDQRRLLRLKRSVPVLEAFKKWLDEQALTVAPRGKLGEAIGYCRNQWTKLVAFLLDGRLEISNNRSERSIKPFVIGRKNWLFANTSRGAKASATIYSLVETAKENNLDPFTYLRFLFETLPNIDRHNPQAVENLLPWSDTAQQLCHNPTKTAKSAG